MKPLICIKCRKKVFSFITKIEECEAVVDGKVVNWNVPNAYCPDCDSMLWCEEFDDIYIDKYEEAIKDLKEELYEAD